jgi:hypothetical protein
MLMMCGGLGGLSINTLCVPLPCPDGDDASKADRPEYLARMLNVLRSKGSQGHDGMDGRHYSNLPIQARSVSTRFSAHTHNGQRVLRTAPLGAQAEEEHYDHQQL